MLVKPSISSEDLVLVETSSLKTLKNAILTALAVLPIVFSDQLVPYVPPRLMFANLLLSAMEPMMPVLSLVLLLLVIALSLITDLIAHMLDVICSLTAILAGQMLLSVDGAVPLKLVYRLTFLVLLVPTTIYKLCLAPAPMFARMVVHVNVVRAYAKGHMWDLIVVLLRIVVAR